MRLITPVPFTCGHISPEKCTALRITLKNTLFSARNHFLQDQALFWQHQILTLFKLTLQETEACDKTLIPSQHSFFSSPSLSLFLLDLIKTRTVLCTAMWEGCGHTSSLNFVLFSAFKPVSHRSDILFSCSLLATRYSWCLPNTRLTHCPQCTWKERGQKSRFAAWLHLFVNSVRAQCLLTKCCFWNSGTGYMQAGSSSSIAKWCLEAGTNSIQIMQCFWWCQERTP